MEKTTLLGYEWKCVQEEPPRCQAACPLHLDGRGLCAAVAKGKFDEGRKIIEKNLPLPGILARICDAPCRKECLRKEAGGAVVLGAIERFCMESGPLRRSSLLVPKNGRSVAVLGGGVSSLTAALDGAKKGYSVTVFRSGDGSELLLGLSPLLSEEIVVAELEWLEKNGVVFRSIDEAVPLSGLMERFDCVYAGLDDPLLALFPDISGAENPVTFETSLHGIFAGGRSSSFIFRAAAGRRGMKSVERFLQGASLTSAREMEGPYATRLFTNIQDLSPEPPLPVSLDGYLEEETVREAKRCILCECLECVSHCVFLQNYKGYPKKYTREIYNNLSVIQGTRLANGMINSCSLCGQCERICPNGFSMRDLCLNAREEMVLQGKMPPSAHEFALEDMAFANSPEASLLRHEPGQARSAFLFFPGCRLAGSSPEQVKETYVFLRHRLEGGVGLWLRCCGAPARWSGRRDLFREGEDDFRKQWLSMGSPAVIAACTSCLEVFRKEMPEVRAVSLWEILAEADLPERNRIPVRPMALHDPCTAAESPEVRNAVRRIVARTGQVVEELSLSGELTSCCGYGGLQECANPGLAARTAEARCAESPLDFLVYCAMCRNIFARTGKRTVHLLDRIFPPSSGDPAEKPAVSYSDQRENRAGLVRELRTSLWKEKKKMPEEHETLSLGMSEEVERKLEKRRILADTVRRTIFEAEKTGRKLARTDGGFLACLRPASVTYWVEYVCLDDGLFEVRNAWSHRMDIGLAGGGTP